jgi:hypothetical protein
LKESFRRLPTITAIRYLLIVLTWAFRVIEVTLPQGDVRERWEWSGPEENKKGVIVELMHRKQQHTRSR